MPRPPRSMRPLLPFKVLFPLLLGVVLSLAILVFSELGFRRLETENHNVAGALEINAALHEVLAVIVDAETSQRGYLLTGRPEYLDPYRKALPRVEERITSLRELVSKFGNLDQRNRVGRINNLAGRKLAELETTLALYEKAGRDAAYALLDTGIGNRTTEQIRTEVAALSEDHRLQLDAGTLRWERDIEFARFGMQIMTLFTIALLLIVWLLARRELRQREDKRRRLVAEQQRLEAEVEARTAELFELSNHLQVVREEEKSRLARDIHDELGGILVSAKMDVSWAEERLKNQYPDIATRLARVQQALDTGVTLKRRIIEELRPTLLDNLGLGAAIEWQVREVCDAAGLAADVHVPQDGAPLPPHVAIALFRIVQEALTNIVRYAKARRVEVELLQTAAAVSLVIVDDGVGIPESAQSSRLSHGISGMRQRVRALHGDFSIRGRHGNGTTIDVTIPLITPPEEPPLAGARSRESATGLSVVSARARP
jgi:signal transduction histidine kinase